MAADVNATDIGHEDVMRDPDRVAATIENSGAVYGLRSMVVRARCDSLVVFRLTLDPWAPMVAEGYPQELVNITVWRTGQIVAVPVNGAARSWAHRQPFLLGHLELVGQLCLWAYDDPPALRWSWSDGLVAFITVVHRHLQAEEFCRRTGRWPSEDAPHGAGPHPIRTPALQAIVAEAPTCSLT